MESPVVSVCVQTYNHVSYIKQCLDGILMQKTDFEFEIIIGEDESSDGTRDICIAYAKKHLDKIRLFLRSRKDVIYINDKPTGRFNVIENLKASKGKYIALCEGDDYWTDSLKLQKQVDFMEENPEYGICFHNVEQLNSLSELKRDTIPNVVKDEQFAIKDYILANKTATCSIMFKRKNLNIGELPNWFKKLPFADLAMILIVMKNSNKKGMVLKDKMGVYRIHENGVHGAYHKNTKGLISAYKQHIRFTKIIRKNWLFERDYRVVVYKKLKNVYQSLYLLYKQNKSSFRMVQSKVFTLYYKFLIKKFS
ncbi:glycosyltransferase [Hyunsoonleella sp. SJ7]|uniref:Glycosyltransferase n=1 Tax=Hyunsoonleella aquatilis TaxID=2762758 RepID=A0A923HB18_9FLAO|nr:glycosyltransferase [Hyunsoonleella aquatilis]MBC3757751.1 glycosyltransferase [Hyunsoonleella aquatilis]